MNIFIWHRYAYNDEYGRIVIWNEWSVVFMYGCSPNLFRTGGSKIKKIFLNIAPTNFINYMYCWCGDIFLWTGLGDCFLPIPRPPMLDRWLTKLVASFATILRVLITKTIAITNMLLLADTTVYYLRWPPKSRPKLLICRFATEWILYVALKTTNSSLK